MQQKETGSSFYLYICVCVCVYISTNIVFTHTLQMCAFLPDQFKLDPNLQIISVQDII